MRRVLFGLVIAAAVGCDTDIAVPDRLDSAFAMDQHSLAFANFAIGFDDAVLDGPGLQRMFGDAVCQPGGDECTLTPAARAFLLEANTAMTGGRCEGFAVLSSLMEAGAVAPTDFGAAVPRALTLEDNILLQRELAYWFATQLVPETVAENTKSYMAKDVMPALVAALSAGATERMRIGIVRKVGGVISGGHALTPMGYYRDRADPAVYWLRVYDNNNPDAERLLKIDTAANRWEFEASENPERASRLYFGDAGNENPLYFAPVLSRQGQLPCPFCADGGAIVTSAGGGEVTIDTPDGPVGLQEGDFVLVDGTSVTPSFSAGLDSEPASVVIGISPARRRALGDDVVMQVRGRPDTENPGARQSVGLLRDALHATVSGLAVTQDDRFLISTSGAAYDNRSGTPLTMSTMVPTPAGALRIEASVNGSSTFVRTDIDPDTAQVVVAVEDAAGVPVTVVLTAQDDSGNDTTSQVTFVSDGTAEVDIDAAAFVEDGSPLVATVDNNGVVTPLVDACFDGVRSGLETDVDCGRVCEARCELTRACTVGDDCATGACHATLQVCVESTCVDGAQTGQETGVDCGGPDCAACTIGAACVANADCDGTSACVDSVCVVTHVLGVVVSGLPPGDTVVLQNEGGDDLVTSSGTSAFGTRIVGRYDVTISSQPEGVDCVVVDGVGVAVADVLVEVSCSQGVELSATVVGLPVGESVTLQNNGADDLVVQADGRAVFSQSVVGAWDVTVLTQPATVTCTVEGGAGVAGDVDIVVEVTCVPSFAVGGALAGLAAGEQVVLSLDGVLLTLAGDGPFVFQNRSVGPYDVRVANQPANQSCTVFAGVGTTTADVDTIDVRCCAPGATGLSCDVCFPRHGTAPPNCFAPVCGDGLLGPDEECDDANNSDLPGCSPTCTIEPGFVCETPVHLLTGSDNAGDIAAVGRNDITWSWSETPDGPRQPAIVSGNCVPGSWRNSGFGEWVTRSGCGNDSPPQTTTYYHATFSLASARAAARTRLVGNLWADNQVQDVVINGVSTGIGNPDELGFQGVGLPLAAWPATLLRAGENTVTIAAFNAGDVDNIEGLLVEVTNLFDQGSFCTPE